MKQSEKTLTLLNVIALIFLLSGIASIILSAFYSIIFLAPGITAIIASVIIRSIHVILNHVLQTDKNTHEIYKLLKDGGSDLGESPIKAWMSENPGKNINDFYASIKKQS